MLIEKVNNLKHKGVYNDADLPLLTLCRGMYFLLIKIGKEYGFIDMRNGFLVSEATYSTIADIEKTNSEISFYPNSKIVFTEN